MIYCCEMAFVTASFIRFVRTKDWFKMWSWFNYSWILYYPLGSLCSVVPLLVVAFFVILNFISMCWYSCENKFPITSAIHLMYVLKVCVIFNFPNLICVIVINSCWASTKQVCAALNWAQCSVNLIIVAQIDTHTHMYTHSHKDD